MIEIRKTQVFEEWFVSLRDRQARLRIQARIDRLMFANPGQHRVLTRGVCEMKIDHGPGYRVYFVRQASLVCCCYAAATRNRNAPTSRRRWRWWMNFED